MYGGVMDQTQKSSEGVVGNGSGESCDVRTFVFLMHTLKTRTGHEF